MGTDVSLSPLYAWSPKGQRTFGSAPRNWGKNVTLLASITREGLGPCLAVEGSTTREVFETYLEDRKSTRLNSSHANISYAVFCLKKKKRRTSERICEQHRPT